MSPAPEGASRTPRAAGWLVLAVLALAWVGVLVRAYGFTQERFFTVDEWQFGHATWLVSQGRMPYRDFYEHHFPLSYVLHAPLLPEEGRFAERALGMRRIPFAYLVATSAALALAITRGRAILSTSSGRPRKSRMRAASSRGFSSTAV